MYIYIYVAMFVLMCVCLCKEWGINDRQTFDLKYFFIWLIWVYFVILFNLSSNSLLLFLSLYISVFLVFFCFLWYFIFLCYVLLERNLIWTHVLKMLLVFQYSLAARVRLAVVECFISDKASNYHHEGWHRPRWIRLTLFCSRSALLALPFLPLVWFDIVRYLNGFTTLSPSLDRCEKFN